MKIIKALGVLLTSVVSRILLWVVLLTPRLIVIAINVVESILRVLKKTLTHLIESIKNEVIK